MAKCKALTGSAVKVLTQHSNWWLATNIAASRFTKADDDDIRTYRNTFWKQMIVEPPGREAQRPCITPASTTTDPSVSYTHLTLPTILRV